MTCKQDVSDVSARIETYYINFCGLDSVLFCLYLDRIMVCSF